jgi:hypothetical protein
MKYRCKPKANTNVEPETKQLVTLNFELCTLELETVNCEL